jgi:hypothetical protein
MKRGRWQHSTALFRNQELNENFPKGAILMKFILGIILLFFGLVFLLPGVLALIVGLIGGLIGLIVGIFGAIIGVVVSIFAAIFGAFAWLLKGALFALLIVLGIYLLVTAGDRNRHVHSGPNRTRSTK